MELTIQDLKLWGVKSNFKFLQYLNEYCERFHVDTPNRIIAFFMNLLHESGSFYYVEEIASGDAYDTRVDLGNTPQKDGDGRKYKGRGLGQITGKANYAAFTKWCYLNGIICPDFVKEPLKLKEDRWAVLSAFWFWSVNKLETYADAGNFLDVCAIWNTGKPVSSKNPVSKINGLQDRIKKQNILTKWLKSLIN